MREPVRGEAGERFAKGETSGAGGFPSPEHKKEKEDPFRRSRKGKKKNRLTTDAVREVRFTFSRFLSILVLSALAVAFLAGLRTTAPDMEYTADNYYDRTHLMDGYAISTLGLTLGETWRLWPSGWSVCRGGKLDAGRHGGGRGSGGALHAGDAQPAGSHGGAAATGSRASALRNPCC